MRPYIDRLVVADAKTLYYAFTRVMVNPIPSDDEPVINSKCFSFLDWTNVGLLLDADVTRRIASFIIDIL